MFESLIEFTRTSIESHGLLGVFFFSMIESFIFPVPTAIIITTATAFGAGVNGVVIVATIGSVLGAFIGYYLGRRGGRPVLVWLFSEEHVERVDCWFAKYGIYAVALAGLSPLPFKVFTISAGVTGLNKFHFFIASVISRAMQFYIFATFGNILGGFL